VTLTKKELAQNLSDQTELSLADAKKFVDLFFDSIKEQLNSGKTVKLSSFGTFDIVQTKERVGRNPKTMEEFQFHQREKLNSLYPQKLKNLLTSLEI
jgi:integration host factor subunit alpha